MKCYLGVVLLGFIVNVMPAQHIEKAGVRVQGRATNRSIKLRWAPNNPSLWKLANKYGYTIERIQMTENGRMMEHYQRTILTSEALRPADEKFWQPHVNDDDYVAVAAQAIFGETFDMTNNASSDIMTIVNKAKDVESRFGFALFSADQSLQAAKLSGLFFEDENVLPGAKYLYRIYSNTPREIYPADTGLVFLGLENYYALPKPSDVHATFEDRVVILSWNGERDSKLYNAYWVERSEDNRMYKKVTAKPIVNTFTGDRPKSRLIFKTDSLPENDVRYYYRVIGINAFGETSTPSDTISGRGRSAFVYSPVIREHEVTPDGKVTLHWTFPEAATSLIKNFDLLRIDINSKESFVVAENISKDVRSVVDAAPRSSNYYVVRANDKYNRSNRSFPYLVQLEDSIPPAAPEEITGRIDTTGLVYLEWNNNEEEDLLGYTIYRANFLSEDFIQIPGDIKTTNTYVDTIRLDNLTETIYYKIVALDKRFNASAFSETLRLEKPDKIPPGQPVFTSIKCDTTAIVLSWEKSSSQDVVQHLLYRKTSDENEWTLIRMIDINDTLKNYRDESVIHRTEYFYTLLAVDDSGLESAPAMPAGIRFMKDEPYPPVRQIFHAVKKEAKKIMISWKYDEKGVERFLVYKGVNDQPLGMYRSIQGKQMEFEDVYQASETVIKYCIVACFSRGEQTRISVPLIIKF